MTVWRFILLTVIPALVCSAVPAEPITHDEDTMPVTLLIAQWVWVDFNVEGITIDVEAERLGASATATFTVGANTHAHCHLYFTPPPGKPAGVDMTAQMLNLAPTSGDAYIANTWTNGFSMNDNFGAGTVGGEVTVTASNVDITDPAGLYAGGEVQLVVDAL